MSAYAFILVGRDKLFVERKTNMTKLMLADIPSMHRKLAVITGANSGIDTLVLADVHTSAVVLSTVCQAVDLDYRLVVVRDCCADPDAEAHAMLLDEVIAKQAAVVTTAEFAGTLPGRSP
jgi:nicotinamidase-related amidase